MFWNLRLVRFKVFDWFDFMVCVFDYFMLYLYEFYYWWFWFDGVYIIWLCGWVLLLFRFCLWDYVGCIVIIFWFVGVLVMFLDVLYCIVIGYWFYVVGNWVIGVDCWGLFCKKYYKLGCGWWWNYWVLISSELVGLLYRWLMGYRLLLMY